MDPLGHLSLSDRQKAELLLATADYCTLAAPDDNGIYLVPISFGYNDGRIYIHSGKHGHKLEVFQDGTSVSLSIQHAVEVVPASTPCKYTTHYMSLLGKGTITRLEDPEQVKAGLNIIVSHYGAQPMTYALADLDRIFVYQIKLESVSFKQS